MRPVVVGKRSKAEGGSGFWDAHFGLIIAPTSTPCYAGYRKGRDPQDRFGNPPMPDVRCTEAITKSNPRGTQNLPRVAPGQSQSYELVADFDKATGKVTWDVPAAASSTRGNVAPPSLGEDSWKWLYLQPLLDHTDR